MLTFSLEGKAQHSKTDVSGKLKSASDQSPLIYANIQLRKAEDQQFVSGTITDEDGDFLLKEIAPGSYTVSVSYVGYENKELSINIGKLSPYLDLGTVFLKENITQLEEVSVRAEGEEISFGLDKKTYTTDHNLSQLGGSALQVMQNLPGITIDREGKVFLRGSDKVGILIDGKQTAITGMGQQQGLENIPASAIERIEIVNNPSAKYDASGMAGIINIIMKKEQQKGWNGKVAMLGGVGGLLLKRESYVNIRSQYRFTPKINPSVSLNYQQSKLNFFAHADVLYHQQMMKNEFVQRTFDDGSVINQQFLENRTQPIYNFRTGLDWHPNDRNSLSLSVLYNYRAYTDLGDIPYLNQDMERIRYWKYYEYELNQTLFVSLNHRYKFKQAGHQLNSSFNYSFRRKDEVFHFSNELPQLTGTDTTVLIADEHIFELNNDYIKPLRHGFLEVGSKQRVRIFPNLITFLPGENSILDPGLDGTAEYRELLSAFYGNYVYEHPKFEIEGGLRIEYARIDYIVDPAHAVYESEGFDYFAPFPNLRASWLIDKSSSLSLFYNRRVDRPEEKDLRVFPTYADPEILVLGNPALEPQFTQSVEAGYKKHWENASFYLAAYHRESRNILSRILTEVPGSSRLASIKQNAGNGQNSGLEMVITAAIGNYAKLNLNTNAYRNSIDAFTVVSAYPSEISFTAAAQKAISGNVKLNTSFQLPKQIKLQATATYLAADIVPQGQISERFFIDAGLTKSVQQGKGEWFLNMSDVFNTLVIEYRFAGNNFVLNSTDYYETQVLRVGYSYRF